MELYGKIIAVYVLAPKTYMVLYVDEKTKAVMMKIRCKGIPRIANDYAAFFKVPIGNKKRAERLFEIQAKNKERLENEEDVPVDYVDIKERAYMFIDHETGKKEILQRIPAQYFIKVCFGNSFPQQEGLLPQSVLEESSGSPRVKLLLQVVDI